MKILFIVGSCLTVNSSANLCHIAYIKGFVKNKHQVTVISASETGQNIDKSIQIPEGVISIKVDSTRLYKLMTGKRVESLNVNTNYKVSLKTRIIRFVKKIVSLFYGPFGYNGIWIKNCIKTIKPMRFDIVFSLSAPVYSHYAAVKLIKHKQIITNKYVQIWEDPWQLDLYREKINKRLLKFENDILNFADRVLYVSPLTAMYQTRLFSGLSNKVDWVPLAWSETSEETIDNQAVFGYFGDFYLQVRNLVPFYNVAKEMNLNVNICGNPQNFFNSTKAIKVYPRLPLNKLRDIEKQTSILVFVCNLKGGQIPGKIYQYSATRKQILFILDGTPEEIETLYNYFSKFNRYVFCKNTEADITKAVQMILSGKAQTDLAPLQYFSPQNIAKLILEKTA